MLCIKSQTEVSAKLAGWIDRVCTYGIACAKRTMKQPKKSLVMFVTGQTMKTLQAYGISTE